MNERINISIPVDLLARIDEAAAAEHLTRSGYLRAAAQDRLGGRPLGGGLPGAEVARETLATRDAPSPMATGQAVAALRGFFAARDDAQVAYLVGSVARGEAGPRSDIDVAVLLDEAISREARWHAQLDLMSRLTAVFGMDDVDVIVLNDASVEVAHSALRDGIVVAGEYRSERTAFEQHIRDRYAASAPEREARYAELRERILSGGFVDR